MRTGVVNFSLDYGKCPKWLFDRMKRLARYISLAVIDEFGPEEFLKRLSDPVWFQSFGCVLAFDWNSSGLTVTTTAALKEALRDLNKQLGVYVCGGKGKTSRKTPEEINSWGRILNYDLDTVNSLVNASKMAAKVDSCLIQDTFQIYHHCFIFLESGKWLVVQQGMNTSLQLARRYHWYGDLNDAKNFIEEPHSGIASQIRFNSVLDLTAKASAQNRSISLDLVSDRKTLLSDLRIFGSYKDDRQQKLKILDIRNCEFHYHPVVDEKFDISRLKKSLDKMFVAQPTGFDKMLITEGVGPKTIRALSLIGELIYGAKPSYEDPARYSFAHGGKDATPYPVDKETYDKSIEILKRAVSKSKLDIFEKRKILSRI